MELQRNMNLSCLFYKRLGIEQTKKQTNDKKTKVTQKKYLF